MKIYTKTGDQGETGLLGGIRVSKANIVVEVTGSLDETNSMLGVAISCLNEGKTVVPESVVAKITQIQNDLFDLGSRIAACLSDTNRAADFSLARAEQLERWIDELDADLPPLTAFILPGGSLSGSLLHQARTVCRRAERNLVTLVSADLNWPDSNTHQANHRLNDELIYLNRLSDLLFVMARYVNLQTGTLETQWQPTRNKSTD